jgi:predicted nucleic acid-binding protein
VIVYFDTNVFAHIEQRKDVSEWDVYVLQRAVKDGKIAIVLSYVNIEETLFIVKSQPERAKAEVYLMLDLADFRLFIKSQEIVIGDDIRSYALGTPSVSPFCGLDPHTEMAIRNAVNPSDSTSNEVEKIVEEVRLDKLKFKAFLEDGKQNLLPYTQQIGADGYPFARYWEHNSGSWAESLAERIGVLDDCRKHGIEGLLKIKSVRLTVGANLSLIYSQHFENVKPKPGDSRDILHAVLASSAEVFVTHDDDFAKALRRVQVEGFRVTDLRSLVKALDRPGAPQWNI